MRKILTLVICIIFFSNSSNAQYVNIPDQHFRDILKAKYPSCFNASDMMDTTCSNIINETSLNCEQVPITCPFTDFTGIQYFKSLRYFNCNRNCSDLSGIFFPLTLDTLICSNNSIGPLAFPPALKYLECNGCNYNIMPSLPGTLQYLSCSENQLTSLMELPGSLKIFLCDYNRFASLPELPAYLTTLSCSSNQLSSLPTLPSGLLSLECSNNQLTNLPALSLSLNSLYAGTNLITTLPTLPASLYTLNVFSNRLSTMPALPPELVQLFCGGNFLTALPELPASLSYLDCSYNALTSLPIFPGSLNILHCQFNTINELPPLPEFVRDIYCYKNNIHCLPRLPVGTTFNLFLSIDDKILCLPNHPVNLTVEAWDSTGLISFPADQLPLCSPVNNISNCQSYPVITGTVFSDNNANGIQDVNEFPVNNIQLQLSNGEYTFSDRNGYFETSTDDIGDYSLTAVPPYYYIAAPAVANFTFTNFDTLTVKNFALQAAMQVDSLFISITPTTNAARPGFPFAFFVNYENSGTTSSSPNIVLNYDNTKLVYDSSSIVGVLNNGNSLSFSAGNFYPAEQGGFTAYFSVKPTAVIGDTLVTKTTINNNSNYYSDSCIVEIRGSFDPNDKQATPQLSPSQVASGKYIDYTIRFQNTGNDTAFNIVISDTLNEDLQAATLQMLASSHSCKATVKDNIVFFEFLNILLPDSNVNALKSHGFVSFRIKPATTVLPNTIIPNKAAIYFDYNAPVITNTAGTLIKDFTVVPLHLISFSAVPQTDNTSTLYWNTAYEINTQQFVIEQGIDGARFNSISIVTAKGKANNNYNANITDFNNGIVYYRLKIVDNDGSFTYSPIIKIDRRKNVAGFSILTNPVKDFIIINTTDRSLNNTNGNIINTQGAVVKSFIITQGSQTIEAKGMPAGIYYLRTTKGSCKILIR